MHRGCDCIPGHLIRSCWYHRRCHQPFQAQNRWCPLFLRSCQCPLCGSWENDLTHRQLLSAAWVILYSHFYWGGLSRTYHCKQGVRTRQPHPWRVAKKSVLVAVYQLLKTVFLMPCAKAQRGPQPWRSWCLSAGWVCVHLPLLLADGVNINRERTWEGPQNKKWKGFLDSYKEAPWRGGGGWGGVLGGGSGLHPNG